MTTYIVPWSMFGVAHVEADNAEEAQQLVTDGCMGWPGDIDWEDNTVDGADIDDPEESR